MEKYDEVLHNLGFAQELHKTLDCLTQNVSLCDRGIMTGTVSSKEFLILLNLMWIAASFTLERCSLASCGRTALVL